MNIASRRPHITPRRPEIVPRSPQHASLIARAIATSRRLTTTLDPDGFASGDPVNLADPFGLCPPKDKEDHPWCHVLFIGFSGSKIMGKGPVAAAGVLLWSEEGPGIYIRGGGGFGGDIGYSVEGGHSSNLGAFRDGSFGGCVGAPAFEGTLGGCFSGNSSGFTESVYFGERANSEEYPAPVHVEFTWTKAMTTKQAIGAINDAIGQAKRRFKELESEAYARMTGMPP